MGLARDQAPRPICSAESEPRMRWQPVDTAPRDGRPVRLLGRYPGGESVVCVLGSFEEGCGAEGWVDERGTPFVPTHWMPDVPP